MPYLAIKKVKGRYYGYMQESFREGGKVRTRTVEYLGSIDPAVAQQYQATRSQLAGMEMDALVQAVRDSSAAAIRAPETPQVDPTPQSAAAPPQQRTKRMMINGRAQLVDMNTGELIKPQEKEVITTETKPTLRPFRDALKLPADMAKHRVDLKALVATHHRYGKRLKQLEINPATMPNVVIRYGHPDAVKRNRDGSYAVIVSRRTRKVRTTINGRRFWDHSRQAMSRAMLDAIETERPALFAELHHELDPSSRAAKRLLFDSIATAHTPSQRLVLSLQLILWNKIPHSVRGNAEAMDFGQMSFETVNDWRGEAALILAEAQKSGWAGVAEKFALTARKHKAMITRRKSDLAEMNALQRFSARLSGKRRKIIRDIMAAETKLRATEGLKSRAAFLQAKLDPPDIQKPWQAINKTRSKLRRTTGENTPARERFATRDRQTDGVVWNVKSADDEHAIYDQAGNELKWKRHKDKP